MRRLRILLADDEPMELVMLREVISDNWQERVELVFAGDGTAAMEQVEKAPVDIAVLDIEMPGATGIQVAKAIREGKRPCQIIFLTAYDDFAYMKEAIHVRAMDYLLKPFNEEEFVMLMDEAIRLSEGAAPDRIYAASKKEEAEKKQGTGEKEEHASENEGRMAAAIRRWLEEHYMEPLSMHDAAEAMNYSDVYFCKLFKQYFMENFTAYLTGFRMKKAKDMLENPVYSIKDVGKAVGYPDQNYFTRVFRRVCGCSPSEYRQKLEITQE